MEVSDEHIDWRLFDQPSDCPDRVDTLVRVSVVESSEETDGRFAGYMECSRLTAPVKKMEASLVKLTSLVNFADDLMDERLLCSVLSTSIRKFEASLVKP